MRNSSFDYLMGIDDFSRMGGFRFKRELDDDYINMSPSFKMGKIGDSASDSCKRNGYV